MDSNLQILTEEIAEKLNVDRLTAHLTLKRIGYNLKLDVSVPNVLIDKNKIDRAIFAAISLVFG